MQENETKMEQIRIGFDSMLRWSSLPYFTHLTNRRSFDRFFITKLLLPNHHNYVVLLSDRVGEPTQLEHIRFSVSSSKTKKQDLPTGFGVFHMSLSGRNLQKLTPAYINNSTQYKVIILRTH